MADGARDEGIFVAWTRYIRRPESMQPFFGYELFFLPAASKGLLQKFLVYLANSMKTVLLILRHRPNDLWIQLAPVFPLYIAVLAKFLISDLRLVADCHNSMFGARWAGFPFANRCLNRCDAVLVHNEEVFRSASRAGIAPDALLLLETRPAQLDCSLVDTTPARELYSDPWVLVPTSFSGDEPISALIQAARLAPEITFVVTGDPRRADGLHDLTDRPENFTLTGYLSKAELDQHLCAAEVIMGLTTADDVQLSVANEATGAEKAMVISDTPLLRRMFDSGAVYVDGMDPMAIVDGVREALNSREALVKGTRELRERRAQRWLGQARALVARLN